MTNHAHDTRTSRKLATLRAEGKSWKAIADDTGVNVGTIHAVAAGKRHAPPRLVSALGIRKCDSGIRIRLTIDEAARLAFFVGASTLRDKDTGMASVDTLRKIAQRLFDAVVKKEEQP